MSDTIENWGLRIAGDAFGGIVSLLSNPGARTVSVVPWIIT